jgi:hypothetical protein
MLMDTNKKYQEELRVLKEDCLAKGNEINQMESVVREATDSKQKLQEENIEAGETAQKAIHLRADAVDALMKLDECRVLMNKLMGPDGPMQPSQRELLPNKGKGAFPIDRAIMPPRKSLSIGQK